VARFGGLLAVTVLPPLGGITGPEPAIAWL
jgi:hypothetical protein